MPLLVIEFVAILNHSPIHTLFLVSDIYVPPHFVVVCSDGGGALLLFANFYVLRERERKSEAVRIWLQTEGI